MSRAAVSLPFFVFVACSATLCAQQGADFTFENSQAFLETYCAACHQGKSPAGGFHVQKVNAQSSFQDGHTWSGLALRVKNGEMPPKGSPAPSIDQREKFTEWIDKTLRAEACSTGITPGPAPIRRLNRDEYTATVQDLLDIHLDLGQSLPADGAGGEGFDNAAETLFLSPIHSEKYMDLAKFALDFAAKDSKSRSKILIAKPGPGITVTQAASQNLKAFLQKAYRRPVDSVDLAPYLALFQAARKQGEPFDSAVLFAMRGILVSPQFLFRVEPVNTATEIRPVNDYVLASRLSYFIWGSMPDELLFDIAEAGKLHDPEILRQQVRRMLRNDRSLTFAQRFVEQWLRTRELSTDKVPDAKLFPQYAEEELRSDIRLQPVLFFREILLRNLSLLNLIDSKSTVATKTLATLYGENFPVRREASKQPQWVDLPEGSKRGGLLGMSAVLVTSSYPYRTSPVLRGAWVLDSLLGTPPPPPPPNVPALDAEGHAAVAKTVRERLTQHRANPACASCHSRIDAIGFALENYDALGRWRTEDAGKPIDSSGELADGTKLSGPEQLKAVLLERKDLFIKNLTNKMLGYALGRGLTVKDSCTVDAITAELKQNDYSSQRLLEAIVLSVPFRSQAVAPLSPPLVSQTAEKPVLKKDHRRPQ